MAALGALKGVEPQFYGHKECTVHMGNTAAASIRLQTPSYPPPLREELKITPQVKIILACGVFNFLLSNMKTTSSCVQVEYFGRNSGSRK